MRFLTEKVKKWHSSLNEKVRELPLIGPLLRHRFTKFGVVGFAGTAVNLGALFVNQEWLLSWIAAPDTRLRLSLALAIFVATLHNFLWNRIWTWRKRRQTSLCGFLIQMGQYYVACSLAIGLQYTMTILFARILHYLVANITACAIAAVINFFANDMWTFAKQRIALRH